MKSKKLVIALLLVFTFGFIWVGLSHAGDSATPQEVIAKVREAATYMEKHGQKGLSAFNKGSPWVWKDTYVFVVDCDKVTLAAHPIKPFLVGKPLASLRDIKGNMFFVQFCQVSKRPNGGWVEYWWPKPGEKTPSRKLTYVLAVKGTQYVVGSGIYSDTYTIAELNKLLE